MIKEFETVICISILAFAFCFCVHRICTYAETTTWEGVEMQYAKNETGKVAALEAKHYWKGLYHGNKDMNAQNVRMSDAAREEK